MPDNIAEKKFETANARLAAALENLEKITIEKLHETSLHSNMFNIGEDEASIKSQMVSQTGTIQSLNEEVNKLQKTISEVSAENEALIDQNKSLLNKINTLRLESESLVDDLETDLMHISKIITRGNECQ